MKKILGISTKSLAKGEINHSPSWYRNRVVDEMMPTPMLRNILEQDCGDRFDNTNNDDENISNYEELYNHHEFIKNNFERIGELFFIEIKTDDRPLYQRMLKDIDDEEIYYDNVIDKVSRAIMNGNNQPFFTIMRKIRRDSQRGGRYNKEGRRKDSRKVNVQFGGRIKEDKTIFSWKELQGCDTDWEKEVNHLGVAISFLEGV